MPEQSLLTHSGWTAGAQHRVAVLGDLLDFSSSVRPGDDLLYRRHHKIEDR